MFGPAQCAELAGRGGGRAGDGLRRRGGARGAGRIQGRQAPLHQDRRSQRHHRDRRLRPPSGRDRRGAEARRAGDRRAASSPWCSRTATRGSQACSRNSAPASTMPTRSSWPTSMPAGETPIEGVNRDALVEGTARARPSQRRCRSIARRARRPIARPRPSRAISWCAWAPARSPTGPTRCRPSSTALVAAEAAQMMPARAPRCAQRLIERLPPVRGRLTENAPLAPLTWFRVGGPAEVMFRPADVEDLGAVPGGQADGRAGDGDRRRVEPVRARRRREGRGGAARARLRRDRDGRRRRSPPARARSI